MAGKSHPPIYMERTLYLMYVGLVLNSKLKFNYLFCSTFTPFLWEVGKQTLIVDPRSVTIFQGWISTANSSHPYYVHCQNIMVISLHSMKPLHLASAIYKKEQDQDGSKDLRV